MNDYYHLVTVVDAQEDSKQILAALQGIKSGKLANDLRLLNYYHEIPVSYGASVDYVEGDMVDLTVHQHQVVVMKFDKKTILKSSHFPYDVISNVFRVKLSNCLVTLTNFAYAVVRAERRKFVRVAVKDPQEAIFADGKRKIHGRLVDISLCGIAVLSSECTENLISQFIFQRQVEIIKELKEQII